MKFDNLHELLDSFLSGALKRILIGAGLTLGTSGAIMITINKLIDQMRDAQTHLPPLAVALADIASLDYYLSFVLGAIVTKMMLKSSQLTLQKLND